MTSLFLLHSMRCTCNGLRHSRPLHGSVSKRYVRYKSLLHSRKFGCWLLQEEVTMLINILITVVDSDKIQLRVYWEICLHRKSHRPCATSREGLGFPSLHTSANKCLLRWRQRPAFHSWWKAGKLPSSMHEIRKMNIGANCAIRWWMSLGPTCQTNFNSKHFCVAVCKECKLS